jgi:hypothetical protein
MGLSSPHPPKSSTPELLVMDITMLYRAVHYKNKTKSEGAMFIMWWNNKNKYKILPQTARYKHNEVMGFSIPSPPYPPHQSRYPLAIKITRLHLSPASYPTTCYKNNNGKK